MNEAKVTIDGVELTSAQVTTLRVALSSFVADVEHLRKLGEIGTLYSERGREVEALLIAGASEASLLIAGASEASWTGKSMVGSTEVLERRLAAVDSALDAELRRALEVAKTTRGAVSDEAYRFRDQLRAVVADDKRREDAGRAMALLYDVPTTTVVIRELLKLFTNEEREALFSKIGEQYCIHCGTHQPARGFCQCTNDE